MNKAQLPEKREYILEEDTVLGNFFELATSNSKYVNGSNLHEIKNESPEVYTGDFGVIGSMLVGEI